MLIFKVVEELSTLLEEKKKELFKEINDCLWGLCEPAKVASPISQMFFL